MSVTPGLSYPFATPPEIGSGAAVEVATGVLWFRLPLFISLPSINIFALEDGPGWTIVDTGVHNEATVQAWETALVGPLGGRPVTRIITTHMHPDHCGMVGWLADRFAAPLWMTRLEYLTGRLMAADTGREAPDEGVRFYRAAGWDDDGIARYRKRFGSFGRLMSPMPNAYRRIRDGEAIEIGGRAWHVVVGSGHSPEHATLHCPALNIVITGDQVLPRISPNVSVFPTEPEADPLSDWLRSLARVRDLIPADTLALPAHDNPFNGLHLRIDHLLEGHHQGLSRLEERLAEPRRAVDVFGALFARPIGPELLGLATGESLAHLSHLVTTGRARRTPDADGVMWWQAISAPAAAG